MDKSRRELGAELGVLSVGTLARAASGEPEFRGGCGCLLGPVTTFPSCLCTKRAAPAGGKGGAGLGRVEQLRDLLLVTESTAWV